MKNQLSTIALYTLLVGTIMSCQQRRPELQLCDASNFETSINGDKVSLYTLRNSVGTTMQVTNYGARVVSLWCEDRDGNWADIVLGFESIDRYINNTRERFLGAAIGRFGNRIADGKFSLNGEEYQLSTYNNGQCLHGGDVGFDKVVWQVDSVSCDALYLSYLSKDMEEGFPGNLMVNMTYQLTADNEFRVDYRATTDRATPVNLTHHSFFNLRGEGQGTINNHILTIAADRYTPVNASLIPTGKIAVVDNTPFDFRTPTPIGDRLNDDDEQFVNCKGYDHNFVLSRKSECGVEFAASVYEPESGRYMEVWTSEPGLQLYGGNFFDGETRGKRDEKLRFRESFALETQHFPDSPNQPQFPSTILLPEEVYTHTCIYKFSAK
ncbi:MAG: aldose epimerase family protein [Rikenellaceae bacterium]